MTTTATTKLTKINATTVGQLLALIEDAQAIGHYEIPTSLARRNEVAEGLVRSFPAEIGDMAVDDEGRRALFVAVDMIRDWTMYEEEGRREQRGAGCRDWQHWITAEDIFSADWIESANAMVGLIGGCV